MHNVRYGITHDSIRFDRKNGDERDRLILIVYTGIVIALLIAIVIFTGYGWVSRNASDAERVAYPRVLTEVRKA